MLHYGNNGLFLFNGRKGILPFTIIIESKEKRNFRQIALADIILVNKIDTVDKQTLSTFKEQLR